MLAPAADPKTKRSVTMNQPESRGIRGARGRALRSARRSFNAAVLMFAALLTLMMTIAAFVLPSSVVPLAVTTVTGWGLLVAVASWVRRRHRALDRSMHAEAARGIGQMERWLASQRKA